MHLFSLNQASPFKQQNHETNRHQLKIICKRKKNTLFQTRDKTTFTNKTIDPTSPYRHNKNIRIINTNQTLQDRIPNNTKLQPNHKNQTYHIQAQPDYQQQNMASKQHIKNKAKQQYNQMRHNTTNTQPNTAPTNKT